jgi:hypothetical protein
MLGVEVGGRKEVIYIGNDYMKWSSDRVRWYWERDLYVNGYGIGFGLGFAIWIL